MVPPPASAFPAGGPPPPPLLPALLRGAGGRCPSCGQGRLFRGFLRPAPICSACGTGFARIRSDDAPPYVTLFIVGHVVVPLMLMAERDLAPPLWQMAALFLPLAALLSLALIRPVKGATIGLMLHLGISGDDQASGGA
ncbi:DUF983 domain-containing protein [Elioraea thermophila]|uniref:DUF983 domain-containing protein n=1 Tax=Elioraea thermophila TaxID=2185104 RepID=UPI001E5BA4F3|nr:DUF983 domain-containing protein [Elioraea thermophila]